MIKRWWSFLSAYFRWDLQAVCKWSKGKGLHDDYHDYPDGIVSEPMHFYTYTCKRCGKKFCI